jgi:hypothetical protein
MRPLPPCDHDECPPSRCLHEEKGNAPRLVRPEFVAQMERELQANQHKGDWRQWYPTPLQVLAEIQHHQGKLMLALPNAEVRDGGGKA